MLRSWLANHRTGGHGRSTSLPNAFELHEEAQGATNADAADNLHITRVEGQGVQHNCHEASEFYEGGPRRAKG